MFPFSFSEMIGIILENLRAVGKLALGVVGGAAALLWNYPVSGAFVVAGVLGLFYGLFGAAQSGTSSFLSIGSISKFVSAASDAVGDFIDDIPVIGSVKRGGQAVYGAVTGAVSDFIDWL